MAKKPYCSDSFGHCEHRTPGGKCAYEYGCEMQVDAKDKQTYEDGYRAGKKAGA